jgi:hypothetical protein
LTGGAKWGSVRQVKEKSKHIRLWPENVEALAMIPKVPARGSSLSQIANSLLYATLHPPTRKKITRRHE